MVDRVLMCPICLEIMCKPILQCQRGHSMCGDCITANCIVSCPQCRGPLSNTRNYQLEQIIENMPKELKGPCFFADRGCKFLLLPTVKAEHEMECKHRKFACEGHKFAKWECSWTGLYPDLEEHFKKTHHSKMEYKMQMNLSIDLTKELRNVEIIPFFNGSQYFWYKMMVDVQNKKVYWVFQFIGPKKEAKKYFYEFEIGGGPIRKFKVTEICESDVVRAEDIFKEEKCVVLSFTALKNYFDDEKKLPVKFRIMGIKKHNEVSK